MRMRADAMFLEVQSVDQVWEALTGDFLHTFFNQQDIYGNTLSKNLGRDKWGLWGRVDKYNQLQAAVRFSSTRKSTESFGITPYVCTSEITCQLCRNNTGFQRSGNPKTDVVFDCGDGNSSSTEAAADSDDGGRQLRIQRPEIRSSLPRSGAMEDRFKFFLYPSESQENLLEVLNYYRARGWIDDGTQTVEIQLYLLNCDQGPRCQLEQLWIHFSFSNGGGIYYARRLEPVFLELFSGTLNMLIDSCWFVVLVITTFFRARLAWRAFLLSELFDHFLEPFNAWEWVILMTGWFNVYGFYLMYGITTGVSQSLEKVRSFGWDLSNNSEDLVEEFFNTVSPQVAQLANLRIALDYYVIILMFRFFVSFGAQPRLAFLTKTMRAVTTDMVHFGAVALPAFIAYVVSGTLMFGRKFEGFATLQASFGTCFRISMESEFDWAEWTEDYYWYIAIWTWTFILMVVLLMINMVMAIILDIYNEVRESTRSKDAETIWTTIFNLCVRLYHFRTWVPERTLHNSLAAQEDDTPSIIGVNYLKTNFPHMPAREARILYADCNRDMKHASENDLDNRSLLKTAGSLMASLDKVNNVVAPRDEASKDPLQVWTAPVAQRTPVSASGPGEIDSFLTLPAFSKGSRQPPLVNPEPDEVPAHPEGPMPKWLQEVHRLLADQRKWLLHAQWQLQEMQWQVQLGHMAKPTETSLPQAL